METTLFCLEFWNLLFMMMLSAILWFDLLSSVLCHPQECLFLPVVGGSLLQICLQWWFVSRVSSRPCIALPGTAHSVFATVQVICWSWCCSLMSAKSLPVVLVDRVFVRWTRPLKSTDTAGTAVLLIPIFMFLNCNLEDLQPPRQRQE